jgi:hypothetical protein
MAMSLPSARRVQAADMYGVIYACKEMHGAKGGKSPENHRRKTDGLVQLSIF